MALSTSKVASQLSNRQRRMLQDMGIDVFTERRTPADARSDIQELTEKTMPLNVSLPNAAPRRVLGRYQIPPQLKIPFPRQFQRR